MYWIRCWWEVKRAYACEYGVGGRRSRYMWQVSDVVPYMEVDFFTFTGLRLGEV